MHLSVPLIALLAAVPYVAAHGYLGQVAIDGTAYAGNAPNNYQGPSPIRLVSDISPVKGSSNPDLNCGLSAQLAEMVVPANPGSSVMFQWYGGGGSKWPHNTGPLMTYMASCGSTTCDKYNSSGAQWFKIDEVGKKSDNTTWFQADIMNGDSFTVVLPQSLAPGDYLIRHEIIALQLAVSVGGAEFYPSCTQVRVGGSASGTPQSTVLFPGAYSDTDPGIYDPGVYNPGSDYVFPGPPISNLAAASAGITPPASATPAFPAASGSASTEASASSATSSAVGASEPTTTAASGASASASAGTTQCNVKRRNASDLVMPRHFSRVMRRIMHSS